MLNFEVLLRFLNDIFLIYSGLFIIIIDEIILFFNLISRSDNTDMQLKKDILEILDFSSLKWKLVGVDISSSLQQILRFI